MACLSTGRASRVVVRGRGVALKAPSARQSVVVRASDAAASEKAIEATDENFKELVLENPLLVLVDFWAPWCGPCRMLAPIIDEVAVSMEGQLVCVKLNTDKVSNIATEYAIRSIPTIILFKDGKRVDTIIGAVPKENLMKAINKVL